MKMKVRAKARQQIILLTILLIMCVLMTTVSDNFLTLTNIMNVLRQNAMIAIAAVSGTMVMIIGGMDISVGSVIAASGVVFALIAQTGQTLWIAGIAAVGIGGLVGLVNACLIVKLGMNSVIATLATQYAFRGIAFLLSDGKTVIDGLPDNFTDVGRGYLGFLPIPVIIMAGIYLLFYVVMGHTLLGKYVYAIGGNEETARLSGINVSKIKAFLYILMGVFTGLSGVLTASRLGSGNPQSGTGFEFDIIVSVLLGGVSMKGGEGSLMGTLLGVLIVGVMSNGLNLLGVSSFYQYIAKGIILVLAVMIDMSMKGKSMFGNKRKKVAA